MQHFKRSTTTKTFVRHRKRNFSVTPKIKVPQEEKQLYKDLIAEHYNVFSKDNNNIGWANNFEHTIITETEKLSYTKEFPIPEAH